MKDHLKNLINRYPDLSVIEKEVYTAYSMIESSFSSGGKLFTCGNGGSASDADHIVGELMKSFVLNRRISDVFEKKIDEKFGSDGQFLVKNLQRGLRSICLNGHPALFSAYCNDVESNMVYAQQLFVMGDKNDCLLAISASGNSENIYRCLQTASVMGLKTILLTGGKGGRCAPLADCAVKVPREETYQIQELHLPIYHALCLALEEKFYGC
ncbi:MAG: phosphoheptose isomerase [Lentisphaerae bacterium GWF2_45_14]|nr:MAG: phosphoheptose isomerase [Lentisphaerae bacterium GWF2_45_14]